MPKLPYVCEITATKYDGSTAYANKEIKVINEKTGDYFVTKTNSSGMALFDLANFDRGWQNEQTIKVEIYDTINTTDDWGFYIGTSHDSNVYNFQYVENINDWKTMTADKGSYKINTGRNPNGVSLTLYISPS